MKIVPKRYGNMAILDGDNINSRALDLYGEWANEEMNLFAKLIKPGMCVLDVGAFIGTYTLAFQQYAGKHGQVYSFEPRKEIFAVLTENISNNKYGNVTAV